MFDEIELTGFELILFDSNEHLPEHIHIENGDEYARVVLETLEVTDSYYNFKSKEHIFTYIAIG